MKTRLSTEKLPILYKTHRVIRTSPWSPIVKRHVASNLSLLKFAVTTGSLLFRLSPSEYNYILFRHCYQFYFHPNQPKLMTQTSIGGVSLRLVPTKELFSMHFKMVVVGWLLGEVDLNVPLFLDSSSWSCATWSHLLLVLLPLTVTDLQQEWWDWRLIWWTDGGRPMIFVARDYICVIRCCGVLTSFGCGLVPSEELWQGTIDAQVNGVCTVWYPL